MTRKLTILSVVATIALVANGLNAQEESQPCQECPALKHVIKINDSESVTLQDGMLLIDGHMVPMTPKNAQPAEGSAPKACPSNCKQCVQTKSSCQACPQCSTATQTSLPPQLAAEFSGSANLPGSTSFMREQCKDLSQNRTKLAGQIAIYLANEEHDPAHVQRVIELAMESAADQAHRNAMHGQVGTTSIEIGTPSFSAKLKALPSAKRKIPAPKPVTNSETELAQQMQMLKAELKANQNVIKLLQKDLQTIAEDVSQLRVESNMVTRAQQTTFPGQPKQTWPSQLEPSQSAGMLRVKNQYTSTRPNTVDSVANLKRRIRVLENQLALMTSESSQVQQVGLQTQSGQLLPRANVRTPLVPSVSQQPQTVVYYVGDVMAPPFVSSTLQLMQYLKANVDPESWGTFADVSITEPSISLEITQTPENHRQIRSILEYIREGKLNYMRKTTRR